MTFQVDFEGVDPRKRGALALTCRTVMAVSVKQFAAELKTTTRTIAAIESGAQAMSEERWDLFVQWVQAQWEHRSRDIVVVVTPEQAPLDVLSQDTYAGFAADDDGIWGVIASNYVDRLTGAVQVRRQRFLLKENQHVLQKVLIWEAELERLETSSAAVMQRWLMRRILKGELNHPELGRLKADVKEKSTALLAAGSEVSEAEREVLIRERDQAIAKLIQELASLVEAPAS